MTAQLDITQPTNPADTVIHLTISSNYLVRLCNTAQAMMVRIGHMKPTGDTYEYSCEAYAELNEIVERIRDQLASQRMQRSS